VPPNQLAWTAVRPSSARFLAQGRELPLVPERVDALEDTVTQARRASAPEVLAELDMLLEWLQACRDKLHRILGEPAMP
jgi:hypothetical protein